MSYETILLASDGSAPAEAAAGHAAAFAEAFDAVLHVVYVLDGIEPPPDEEDPARHPDLEAKRRRALNGPTALAERRGVDVRTTAVRAGTPGETLLAYVDEHGVDLVVMGTHGRSGLERVVVGSVAEDVVRNAPVPVVTVRPNASSASVDREEP